MNQPTISLQEKKDAINKYLTDTKHTGTTLINNSKSETDINEIYDLYYNNVVPTKITKLHRWYAIYYTVNKQFDKMVDCYVIHIEKNPSSKISSKKLYNYMKDHPYDQQYLKRLLVALKNKNTEIYNLFARLSKSQKTKSVKKISTIAPTPIPTTPESEISKSINQHIQNNEMNKIYDMYPQCKNTDEKTQYLSKVMILKDFKPTKEMINDLLTLDFSNASPEIHLIKSLFAGLSMNAISL